MSPADPEARASFRSASIVFPQHVVHREFAKETVILNLQSGMYHGLNPTGQECWPLWSVVPHRRRRSSRASGRIRHQPTRDRG